MEPNANKNIYFVIIAMGVISGFSLIFSGYIFLRQQSLEQVLDNFSQLNQSGTINNNNALAPVNEVKEISGNVRAINENVIIVNAKVLITRDISDPRPPEATLRDYLVTLDRLTIIKLVTFINPGPDSRPEDLVSAPVAIPMTDIKAGDFVKIIADTDVAKISSFVAKSLTVFR